MILDRDETFTVNFDTEKNHVSASAYFEGQTDEPSAPTVETFAYAKIKLSAVPSTPNKSTIVRIYDANNKLVSTQTVGFASVSPEIKLPTPAEKNIYTIKVSDVVDGDWKFTAPETVIEATADEHGEINIQMSGESNAKPVIDEPTDEPTMGSSACQITNTNIVAEQGDFTFSCNRDVNLIDEPLQFEITNGVKIESVWGFNKASVSQSGNVVTIAVEKWWPAGAGYEMKAGEEANISFKASNSGFEIKNISSVSEDGPGIGDEPISTENSAHIRLESLAIPRTPNGSIKYRILDANENIVKQGIQEFNQASSMDLSFTGDEQTYTIEADEIIDGDWTYRLSPISFTAQADQTETVVMEFTGEEIPMVRINMHINQLSALDRVVEAKFKSLDTGEIRTLDLTSDGNRHMSLPLDTGIWQVIIPSTTQYSVSIKPMTVDTGSEFGQNVTVDFTEKEVESSAKGFNGVYDKIAIKNGFDDARDMHTYLYMHTFHENITTSDQYMNYMNYAFESGRGNMVGDALSSLKAMYENPLYRFDEIGGYWFSYTNISKALNRQLEHSVTREDMSSFMTNDNYYENVRELAAFFANIGQETNGGTILNGQRTELAENPRAGILYSFTHYTEGNCYEEAKEGKPNPGCNYDHGNIASLEVPPMPGQQYYGRGPKQLSYPENYKNYGQFVFDENGSPFNAEGEVAIYANPDLLVTDPVRTWQTAFAFMILEDKSSAKPSMVQAMHDDSLKSVIGESGIAKHGPAGFGQTINVINGAIECGSDAVSYQQLNRINNYLELMIRYGVGIDNVQVTMSDGSLYDPAELTPEKLKSRVLDQNYDRFNWGRKPYVVHTQPLPVELYIQQPALGVNYPVEVKVTYSDDTNLSPEILSCGVGFAPYGS